MARKSKFKDVAKFGGVDALGSTKLDRKNSVAVKDNYEVNSIETQSQTNLEQDVGEGEAVILRCFIFQMNLEKPELFIERQPTKQDLFNSHLRGIEMALYKDGMKIYDAVAPRIIFDKEKFQYSIFVAARPMRGYILQERPQTLTEIAHGWPADR